MRIAVESIRLDISTQPRAKLDANAVARLIDDIRAEDPIPPIVVCKDADGVLWLADGWHRVAAAMQMGCEFIDAAVRDGTARDAYMLALGLNKTTSLSLDDRKRAAARLLSDVEWSTLSDREIGRRCGLNHETVGGMRESSGENRQMTQQTKQKEEKSMGDVIPLRPRAITVEPTKPETEKRTVTRKGKTYEMKVKPKAKKVRKDRAGARPKRLNLRAWAMVRGTSVGQDENQKRQLERLSSAEQLSVAKLISRGDKSTVKEAIDSFRAGAPVDEWSAAYQAAMKLPPDDRLRLCRMVEQETKAEMSASA